MGAMPSQFRLEAHGRSESSAESAMQPARSARPNAAQTNFIAFIGSGQSAKTTSPSFSLSCSHAPRMSQMTYGLPLTS